MAVHPNGFAPQWIALGVTVALSALVGFSVDLRPQVDENFFFSSNDPQFQENNKINKMFPSENLAKSA